MDLDSMKYPKLRSLAKQLGLKSNMKADRLLKTIKLHYEEQLREERVMGEGDVDPTNTTTTTNTTNTTTTLDSVGEEPSPSEEEPSPSEEEPSPSEEEPSPSEEEPSLSEEEPSPRKSLFVTSRRGKNTKRKISDGEQPLTTAQVEPETTALAEGGRVKRRRVSAAPEPEPGCPAAEQPAEVQPAACDPGNGPKVVGTGKIPRYEALVKRNRSLMKPITPNFKKLHEAHFNKMESIDSYVQRKTKRMMALKTSTQDLKLLPERTLPKPADRQQQPQVKFSRASLVSPAVFSKPVQNKARASGPVQREPSFRPSVLSTRRINVRFSEATQDHKAKVALQKTPARLSSRGAQSTPGGPTSDKPSVTKSTSLSVTKSTSLSVTRSPAAFVFTGNTSLSTTPGTNKPSFNLKASLSKPLSYKPHKGKLKPFGETKENTNTAANSSVVQMHQKNYKQHQVQSREERRTRQTQDRKQKKESTLGARRGLVMS